VLSLPMQVSTTIRQPEDCRRPGDSITKACTLMITLPSGLAKCGRSHGTARMFSGEPSFSTKVAFEVVSISTTRVMVTSPIFQRFICGPPR
jgi:hypothetical protein